MLYTAMILLIELRFNESTPSLQICTICIYIAKTNPHICTIQVYNVVMKLLYFNIKI